MFKPPGLHLQDSAVSVCLDLLEGQAGPALILQFALLVQGGAIAVSQGAEALEGHSPDIDMPMRASCKAAMLQRQTLVVPGLKTGMLRLPVLGCCHLLPRLPRICNLLRSVVDLSQTVRGRHGLAHQAWLPGQPCKTHPLRQDTLCCVAQGATPQQVAQVCGCHSPTHSSACHCCAVTVVAALQQACLAQWVGSLLPGVA